MFTKNGSTIIGRYASQSHRFKSHYGNYYLGPRKNRIKHEPILCGPRQRPFDFGFQLTLKKFSLLTDFTAKNFYYVRENTFCSVHPQQQAIVTGGYSVKQ